jgi:Rrf2 family protein
VLHIAAHPAGRPLPVGEIASALGVPRNYLSKTLHQLARAGVLTSARGPTGGFRLATPADQLTLERIVSTFTGATAPRCLLRDAPCGESPACAVHARWAPVAARLHEFFGATRIADLLPDSLPVRGAQCL